MLYEWKYFTVFCSVVRGRTAAVQTERTQELDRALIQQLRERCEQQALQLQSLQDQFKKASMCLDVFSITTQHFCHKVGDLTRVDWEANLVLPQNQQKKPAASFTVPSLHSVLKEALTSKLWELCIHKITSSEMNPEESPGFNFW